MQMGRILYFLKSGRLTQAFLLLLQELAVAIKFLVPIEKRNIQ
jgi:hypothetical protein